MSNVRICLLLLFIVCPVLHAATWKQAFEDTEQKIYVDVDSVKIVRGEAHAWVRWTFKKKRSDLNGETYQSYMKQKIYNCESGTAVTRKIVAYNTPDWSGKVAFSAEYMEVQHDEADIFPVKRPVGAREKVLGVVCAKDSNN